MDRSTEETVAQTPHPSPASGPAPRRLGLLTTLVVAVLIVGLVGASFWDALWGEQNPPPTAAPTGATIPPLLGALPLAETVTGDEGLAQVNRLHGKEIELTRGFVAHYARDGTRATVWAGWAGSETAAQDLTDRMTAQIGPDHPIFQDFQALTVGGRPVYTMVGQGQQHFYFRSGAAVVWVAVDSSAAQEVMHDALKEWP